MRRYPFIVLLTASVFVLSCSDSDSSRFTSPPSFSGAGTNACLTVDSLRNLLTTLFPAGQQPFDQFDNLVSAIQAGDAPSVQRLAFELLDQTLNAYHAGQLNGGTSQTTREEVVDLVNGIFCISGVPGSLPIGALDPDGAAVVLTPTSPTTDVVTDTKLAGVTVPGGSVPQTILVTVSRLPDSPGPLLTSLDQFPDFYQYTASPDVTFNQDVLVAVCQPAGLVVPDPTRLRLAHNIAPFIFGSVEILPLAAGGFLTCPATTGGVSPNSTGGVGGTTKHFSPFGAVDPTAELDANSPTQQNGTAGGNAVFRPSVAIVTPGGKRVAGVTVTFVVSSGGGSLVGAVQVTDANGVATVTSWKLGPNAGANTVTATATLQGVTFTHTPIVFTATATKKATKK